MPVDPPTSADTPRVSVVIPCRNEREHIEACITDLLAQEGVPGGMEILVADGRSDDGTRAILEDLERRAGVVRMIDNPARVVPAGLNAAIRQARGEVVIRIDVHTRYASDYLRECVQVLGTSGADNVGGPWVAAGRGYLSEAIAAAFQSPLVMGGARGHDPRYEGPVDTVYLGCWRRETLFRLGLFDEELVRNQDDELNLRIVRSGGRVWQSPRIRSSYRPRRSLRELSRQYAQYGYWKVRVMQKHHLPAALRHVVPGAFVGVLLGLLLLAPFAPGAGTALGVLVGVYGAFGLVAAAGIAHRAGWKYAPVLPVVIGCYQLGYGWGFLRGVFDFVLLRRGAARSFGELTREASGRGGRPPRH